MKTIKQEAMEAIALLPDNSEIDDIMYRLYIIDKVRQGQQDVLDGQVITTEELRKDISKW